MYYPYFRGKQFELITIRDTAPLLAEKGFVPIIEPVQEALGGLERTLKAICAAGGQAIVIVNPYHGAHQQDSESISQLFQQAYIGNDAIAAGILLRSDMTTAQAVACYRGHADHNPVLIHVGFSAPKELATAFTAKLGEMTNVFVEEQDKLLYRKHFDKSKRVLVRDGFKRQRNADYPLVEEFSDLHITFKDRGMTGFGDFLIVGDIYSDRRRPGLCSSDSSYFHRPREGRCDVHISLCLRHEGYADRPCGEVRPSAGEAYTDARQRHLQCARNGGN